MFIKDRQVNPVVIRAEAGCPDHTVHRHSMTIFVHSLAANGALQNGLDEAYAGEIVWTLTSPEVFQLLTAFRGWTKEKYLQWLAETLTRLLLP
jgi:hypothetical protein